MNRYPGNGSPYRLLVLAPNWLGDVVMHTSLLSFLDDSCPAAAELVGRPVAVHLGVRRVWGDLFRDDPRLDGLVLLDRNRRDRGVGGTLRLASLMRRGRFDAVILGPPSFRAGMAARLARVPARVGYRTDGRSALLTVGLESLARGTLHYSREMVALGLAWLESVGSKLSTRDGPYRLPSLPGLTSLPPAAVGDGPPVWTLAPGTTFGEAKVWPLNRLGDFIELVIQQEKVRVVLLGDASVRDFTAALKGRFPDQWSTQPGDRAPVTDLTGQTDLPAAVSMLKASAAFIGNDSGLMHLAAALGRPTLGIFGSSNPDWTAPLGRHARAIFPEGYSCRPCYRKTCNQPEFCLDSVSGEAVLAAVKELVAGARVLGEGS